MDPEHTFFYSFPSIQYYVFKYHLRAAAAAAVALVVSDSVQPHRRQPTRLRHSPGKNTGVCCHFLLQCMKVKVKSLSRVWLFETPWTAAYKAPPSMGFSRQEHWSGSPLPSPSTCYWRPNIYLQSRLLSVTQLSWDGSIWIAISIWKKII